MRTCGRSTTLACRADETSSVLYISMVWCVSFSLQPPYNLIGLCVSVCLPTVGGVGLCVGLRVCWFIWIKVVCQAPIRLAASPWGIWKHLGRFFNFIYLLVNTEDCMQWFFRNSESRLVDRTPWCACAHLASQRRWDCCIFMPHNENWYQASTQLFKKQIIWQT